MAEIYSEDPGSAQNGGDLGYFTRSQMVAPFSDAAFKASEGQVVGPVESRFGLHIIKVEDKRIQDGERQVKARHILLKFEASSTTRDDMREIMTYVSEAAQEDSLSTVATGSCWSAETTPPFTRDGSIPGIGIETSINRFAFQSEVGQVSELITTQDAFYVLELAKVQNAHIQLLDNVRTRIVNSLKAEKRMQAAREHCEAGYEQLKQGASFDQVAAMDSLKVNQTKPFTLSGTIPGVGREPRFAGTAFALEEGDFSEPVKGSRGYYLLQLIEKDEFDEKAFNARKEELATRIARQRRNQIFAEWYENIKERATIKDYRDEIM
ncbi:MAG: peptidylprolyl isomerase [candidate division KSB1 bacterium]|nr:peptidylprolyl isomerase [candidate division KSB1 bacterium]